MKLRKGDRVRWQSSGRTVEGKVEQKLTSPTDIKGHHVAASEENPEYLVRSTKSDKPAAHKAESLEKIKK